MEENTITGANVPEDQKSAYINALESALVRLYKKHEIDEMMRQMDTPMHIRFSGNSISVSHDQTIITPTGTEKITINTWV